MRDENAAGARRMPHRVFQQVANRGEQRFRVARECHFAVEGDVDRDALVVGQ